MYKKKETPQDFFISSNEFDYDDDVLTEGIFQYMKSDVGIQLILSVVNQDQLDEYMKAVIMEISKTDDNSASFDLRFAQYVIDHADFKAMANAWRNNQEHVY